MANEQNLKPLHPTSEEATRNGRKGGIASGKARRERKTIRELVEKALDTIIKTKQNGKDVEMTAKEAIVLKQLQKALHGDIKSAEMLIKHIGEAPPDKVEVEGNLNNTLEVKITGGSVVVPTADNE